MRKLLETERAVHAHASKQLDETLAEFRRAFDVDALVKTFEHALDGMMARGTWRNNSATGMGTGTTLLVDDCARSCAAQALDAKVRLRYETTDQLGRVGHAGRPSPPALSRTRRGHQGGGRW